MCIKQLQELRGGLNEKVINIKLNSPPYGFYGDIIMTRSNV